MNIDYIQQLTSISNITSHYINDVTNIINIIGKYIFDILQKIKYLHEDLYLEFIKKITTNSKDYVGYINESELEIFLDDCNNCRLTICNSRNIINMLWSFIKIIVSNIIFIGTTENLEEDYIFLKSNIDIGINYLKTFINFNSDLLTNLINKGFYELELEYGIENLQTINRHQFYKYIIRLSFLEARKIADLQKSDTESGFIADKMFDFTYDIINKYFLNYELNDFNKLNKIFPFSGNFIGNVNVNTNYYRFCTINNLYSVCGLSGSTFELLMYVFMFGIVDQFDEIQLKSTLILFLHFHLIRGTHSDLEVVCAFEKISKWFPELNSILSTIITNNMIVFNRGMLLENLFLNFKSDINKLKYRFE